MRTLLALLVLLPAASVARADAIEGAPEDCPRGSLGDSSHSGQWCAPTICATAADCNAYGSRGSMGCETQGLCIESESYVEGGNRPIEVPPVPLTREVARSACTVDADCAAGARCVVVPRCVEAPHPVAGALARACGCRAGARGGGAAGALALGLVVLAQVARTRRARRR